MLGHREHLIALKVKSAGVLLLHTSALRYLPTARVNSVYYKRLVVVGTLPEIVHLFCFPALAHVHIRSSVRSFYFSLA